MTDQPILNPQGKGTFWYVPQSTALMAALAAEAKAAGLDPDKVAWGPYLQARLYAWYNLGAVPFSGKTSRGSGKSAEEKALEKEVERLVSEEVRRKYADELAARRADSSILEAAKASIAKAKAAKAAKAALA